MDDVFKRLGGLENDVSAIKVDLAGLRAVIPQLATKADVSDMEASIIQWMVATAIAVSAAVATVTFAIAKLVH